MTFRMKHLAAAIALAVSLPAAAHHAAEGIISDDVWQRIDDMLEATPSMHLDLDFDSVMGSMAVVTVGNGGGDMALTTSVVVDSRDVDDLLAALDVVLDDMQRMPQGRTSANPESGVFVEVTELDDRFTQITLYEPIGSGQSQTNPTESPRGGR
ncbi:MAG: hypothetical protein QNJ40_21140 [Xanthomonadales bacterium]|nr:hypothetical protein [Xanthomonadales bacterium]